MKAAHCILLLALIHILLVPKVLYSATIGESVGIASSLNPVGSGARALGMGGAFIAVADDATAASWNPAGLVQLETPELSLVGAYVYRTEDFFSSTHPESNSKTSIDEASINYFSATYPFNFLDRNMVVSINYQRLYDFRRNLDYHLVLSSTTPPPLPPSTIISSEHRTYNQDGYLGAFGVAYAVEITPRISLGLTLNLWTDRLGWQNGWESTYSNHSTTTFGALTVIEDTSIAEKYSEFEGFNMNLGALWSVNKYLTIGAVFKTPFTADLRYENTEDSITRDANGNTTGAFHGHYSENNELEMPMSYGLGASWRFSDEFTMDMDIYRTHWSEYILTDGQGNQMSPINALPKDQSDVKDTTQVRLGAEYLFFKPNSKLIIPLRGGVFYDPEPAQGKVKDFYGVSLGSGISYIRYNFDLAYQLRWGQDVDTGNVIASSTADIMQHTLLFSFILHF